MEAEQRRWAFAIGGAVLLFVGISSNSWWSASEGPAGVRVGLRDLEMCIMGMCQSVPFAEMLGGGAGGGSFKVFSTLTWFLGIVGSLGIVAHAYFRGSLDSAVPQRVVLGTCSAVVVFGICTLVSVPGGSGVGMSWGFFAAALGALVGGYSSLLEPETEAGWSVYEAPTEAPVGETPASTPIAAAPRPVAPIELPQEEAAEADRFSPPQA